MNPENPNHHCLHCDTMNKDWEERRFCCANCEDEFLFHITQKDREKKIKDFIKKSNAFAETEVIYQKNDTIAKELGYDSVGHMYGV